MLHSHIPNQLQLNWNHLQFLNSFPKYAFIAKWLKFISVPYIVQMYFSKQHQYSMWVCLTTNQHLNSQYTCTYTSWYGLFIVYPWKIFSQRKTPKYTKERNVERKYFMFSTTMTATNTRTYIYETRIGKIQFIFWRCNIKSLFFATREKNQRNRIIYSENNESDLLNIFNT